jgi:hypothetical protein
MPNIVTINMRSSSIERIFKGHQICLLADTPQCYVGDIFPLQLNGETRYFRVIDIWTNIQKDFALKYLWALCGTKSSEELKEQFDKIERNGLKVNTVFAHIYAQISSFDEIHNLVKS